MKQEIKERFIEVIKPELLFNPDMTEFQKYSVEEAVSIAFDEVELSDVQLETISNYLSSSFSDARSTLEKLLSRVIDLCSEPNDKAIKAYEDGTLTV